MPQVRAVGTRNGEPVEGYGFVEQYFGAQNHDFRSMLDGVSKVRLRLGHAQHFCSAAYAASHRGMSHTPDPQLQLRRLQPLAVPHRHQACPARPGLPCASKRRPPPRLLRPSDAPVPRLVLAFGRWSSATWPLSTRSPLPASTLSTSPSHLSSNRSCTAFLLRPSWTGSFGPSAPSPTGRARAGALWGCSWRRRSLGGIQHYSSASPPSPSSCIPAR
eukprot:scaffold8847_cov112-Isochrysis_galbana.AAC.9